LPYQTTHPSNSSKPLSKLYTAPTHIDTPPATTISCFYPAGSIAHTLPETSMQHTFKERKKSLTSGHVKDIGSAEGIQSYSIRSKANLNPVLPNPHIHSYHPQPQTQHAARIQRKSSRPTRPNTHVHHTPHSYPQAYMKNIPRHIPQPLQERPTTHRQPHLIPRPLPKHA